MKLKITRKQIPLITSIAVFIILYTLGFINFRGFQTCKGFTDLFYNSSFIGILAVGMTFVIISGGIDLSVGSAIAFMCTFLAWLIEFQHVHPLIAMLVCLITGTIIGILMGSMIHFFKLPAFLVTLVGMFAYRGLAYQVSLQSIPITNEFFLKLTKIGIRFDGKLYFPIVSLLFIGMVIIGAYIMRYRKTGRNIYAIGGSEQSANLMGLPIAKTKLSVYGFSGFCSALGGIAYAMYLRSGYSSAGRGMELIVIASVVIGGTLLVGGHGSVEGTMLGVLVLGTIKKLMDSYGQLISWWRLIFIGVLLYIFILIQAYVTSDTKITWSDLKERFKPKK